MQEHAGAQGFYKAVCHDQSGNIRWDVTWANLITTQGKNYVLDYIFSLPGYTIVGPYLGLISATGFTSGPASGDRADSHPGWIEASNYSGGRKVLVFSSASNGAKTASSPASYNITANGTIKGACLFMGNGATNVIGSTTGILYSDGVFSDRIVVTGDILSITWSTSL